ncbi:MAG TPA: hypothetical protein VD866_09995 [Urbifossiella sp.]|nr:hypothetical protein [Urbifossiella sp.]
MTSPSYRVVWLYTVRPVWLGHLLIDLGARGESSDTVFEAMDRVTAELTRDPESYGESREDGTRIYCDPVLTVIYEVHPDDHLVLVVRAHYVRRPRNPAG